MLRLETSPFLHWRDKTMTAIRDNQLDALEDALSALPCYDYFDDVTQPDLLRAVYDNSYYRMEDGGETLMTNADMRALVMQCLTKEASVLPTPEAALLERVLSLGGDAELLDEDELPFADSLTRRLWGYLQYTDDEEAAPVMHIHTPLINGLTSALSLPGAEERADKVLRFEATVRALLYIAGFLYYAQPLEQLCSEIFCGLDDESRRLAMRFLRADFDYLELDDGGVLLIHPALAQPEQLLERMTKMQMTELTLSAAMFNGGVNGLLPEEAPSTSRMEGLFEGALRPEADSPAAAAEDLRLLVKQDVGLADLRAVLDSMLMVLPSQDMLDALRQMYRETPRWAGMSMAVVN